MIRSMRWLPGKGGMFVVIFGALLATSSAISGTLFGASRLAAVIAADEYLHKVLSARRKVHIPYNAILMMSVFAFVLLASGGVLRGYKFIFAPG